MPHWIIGRDVAVLIDSKWGMVVAFVQRSDAELFDVSLFVGPVDRFRFWNMWRDTMQHFCSALHPQPGKFPKRYRAHYRYHLRDLVDEINGILIETDAIPPWVRVPAY